MPLAPVQGDGLDHGRISCKNGKLECVLIFDCGSGKTALDRTSAEDERQRAHRDWSSATPTRPRFHSTEWISELSWASLHGPAELTGTKRFTRSRQKERVRVLVRAIHFPKMKGRNHSEGRTALSAFGEFGLTDGPLLDCHGFGDAIVAAAVVGAVKYRNKPVPSSWAEAPWPRARSTDCRSEMRARVRETTRMPKRRLPGVTSFVPQMNKPK